MRRLRHAFRHRLPFPAALALALCATAAQAAPARYVLDPVHTRILFAIDHAGFSHALGTVSGSQGELWFDPDDWSVARLRATAVGRRDFLLRTEMAAGHGGVSGRYKAWHDRSFALAWMLDRMGLATR